MAKQDSKSAWLVAEIATRDARLNQTSSQPEMIESLIRRAVDRSEFTTALFGKENAHETG
jgi:hypothetical protein